jgi:hypothetical protein
LTTSKTIEMGRDDATGATVPLPTSGYIRCVTIYESPSDHPKKFVVREQRMKGGRIVHALACHIGDSLAEARAKVPAGLTNVGRQPGDDSVIREVWL